VHDKRSLKCDCRLLAVSLEVLADVAFVIWKHVNPIGNGPMSDITLVFGGVGADQLHCHAVGNVVRITQQLHLCLAGGRKVVLPSLPQEHLEELCTPTMQNCTDLRTKNEVNITPTLDKNIEKRRKKR